MGELQAALAELSARAHDRLTVKQALYFISVAYAHAMGRSITLSDVIERFEGTGSLGGAIRKSNAVFLAPTPRLPDALGWLEQAEDPTDRRYKFLRLTDAGLEATAAVLNALRGAD